MGALEPELEIIETPNTPLDLPGSRLQEDTCDTTCAPGECQPVAMENKILTLQTRVTHLKRDLAVAHARIQDLTEFSSFLRRTSSNPTPARAQEAAEPPPPPEHPPPPESCQSSMPPSGHSRLSFPALVTCLGESLPAGVGLNNSYTDTPLFDGSDGELYKDWKRAVLRKLKMSTWLYPTPESGGLYMASRLAGVAADILTHAIDEGEPEADDVGSAFLLADVNFQDSDEYGTAFAAMERLIMKADDMVDTLLAKWNKLNIKLGRDKNSRLADTESGNKLSASLTSKLLDLRATSTLAQLVERARWDEQNHIQLNQSQCRESKPPSTNRPRIHLARTSVIPCPSSASTASQTNKAPHIPRLDEAAKQLAREQEHCFRCRRPGHRAANSTAFSSNDRPQKPTRPPAYVAGVGPVKKESEYWMALGKSHPMPKSEFSIRKLGTRSRYQRTHAYVPLD